MPDKAKPTFNREAFAARIRFATPNARLRLKSVKFDDGSTKTTLTGYPITWGNLSSDRGGYKVRLCKGAANFEANVLALWNHQFDKPLAGTVNETLRILAADDVGVPIEMDLDLNTTAGADCYAYVNSGLVGGMSFSMANGFENYTESKEGNPGEEQYVINVSRFTVDEVTVTPIPAFEATSIAVKAPENDPQKPTDPPPAGPPPVAGGMSKATPNRTAAAHKLARYTLDLHSA